MITFQSYNCNSVYNTNASVMVTSQAFIFQNKPRYPRKLHGCVKVIIALKMFMKICLVNKMKIVLHCYTTDISQLPKISYANYNKQWYTIECRVMTLSTKKIPPNLLKGSAPTLVVSRPPYHRKTKRKGWKSKSKWFPPLIFQRRRARKHFRGVICSNIGIHFHGNHTLSCWSSVKHHWVIHPGITEL